MLRYRQHRVITFMVSTVHPAGCLLILDVPTADREKIMDQYETSVFVETATTDASGNTGARHVTSIAVALLESKKAKTLDVLYSGARPRLLSAVSLMEMQQLSSINGVLYVGSPLLLVSPLSHDLPLFSFHQSILFRII
ncbi:hypothetical protein F5Y06DRAFT_45461 [Hypoxylon sp. FL0890]|nr:hypothetical protein F5Y06DRAFT_45461 [Hypoxylon sp. FL0890]